MLNFITGGVCAAQGFRAGGIHVGVKTHAAWKKDVAPVSYTHLTLPTIA